MFSYGPGDLGRTAKIKHEINTGDANPIRQLVSRAIRIFHVLIIERAPQKGGRGRKNTYSESGHVFVCTAKILAAPIRIQSRTHHVTSHLKYH